MAASSNARRRERNLDSEDERLWFALADLYHSGHQDPLNSDVPGSLQVDAYTDIVAVVIAPLAPVDDAQDAYRPGESAAHDAVVDVGHYLEHANADATLTTYVSQVSSGDFNDRLIALTRAELMAAVEKRVLGEVAQVLETYRNESWNTATVYPWLAPLGDPSASAFEASVGTSVGYLSYHEPNDAFATSYLMDWDLNSATVNRWGTVKGWQLRDDTVSFSTTEGTCTWATEEQVTCGGVKSFTKKCLGVSGTPVDRTYSFVFTGLTGTVSIVPPASSSHRQRTVDIPWTNPLDPVTTTLSFTMQDVATSGPKLGQVCGSGTLVNDGNTRGRILAQSLRYDLGVPNELPSWVLDQQWHHLLYAAVSDAEMPGGSGNCPGVDCLTLTGVSPDNDKAALLVAAGGALASQNRSVWSIGAYFEAENKITNNGIFAKARLSQTFNDQIRVVSP